MINHKLGCFLILGYRPLGFGLEDSGNAVRPENIGVALLGIHRVWRFATIHDKILLNIEQVQIFSHFKCYSSPNSSSGDGRT